MASRWSDGDDAQLVEAIYDAAFDETSWTSVLQRVADRVGGGPVNLTQLNVVDGHGFGIDARTPEGTMASYFQEWAHRNVLGLVQDPGDYRSGWTARITRDTESRDRELLERSDYWNEFLRPIEASHILTIRLALRGDDLTSIGIGRSLRAGPCEDHEIAALQSFHPHLIRAERMWRTLGLRRAELEQLDTLLATSPDALFFLDDRLAPQRWTVPAETLMRSGGLLRISGGRLRSTYAGADAALQHALTTALAGGAPAPVRVPAPDPAKALTLSIARIGGRSWGSRGLLVSARTALPDTAHRLRDSFGLTAAESELALALWAGESLRAIATRRGVSVNTVRNQLSSVFDKTGCRRQQDLIRMLAGHAGGSIEPQR